MLKIREYPKGVLPAGTLSKVEDAVERAVFVPLVKDEPILDARLAPKGAKRGMAALVPTGMRAFTIHTPSVASGVGGFVLPGNKVDVLLTTEGKRGGITSTLVQNLEILAVDQRTDAPADNRVDPSQLRSVTLLVTPDEAAKLALAQHKGALHLSLRNHRDDELVLTPPARLSEFDDADRGPSTAEPVAIAKARPPGRFLTIYRAGRLPERLVLGEAPTEAVATVTSADESAADQPR
jgi:pilus assembly protein CpaB